VRLNDYHKLQRFRIVGWEFKTIQQVIQQKIIVLTKIQYPLLSFIAARASTFGQENSEKVISYEKEKPQFT